MLNSARRSSSIFSYRGSGCGPRRPGRRIDVNSGDSSMRSTTSSAIPEEIGVRAGRDSGPDADPVLAQQHSLHQRRQPERHQRSQYKPKQDAHRPVVERPPNQRTIGFPRTLPRWIRWSPRTPAGHRPKRSFSPLCGQRHRLPWYRPQQSAKELRRGGRREQQPSGRPSRPWRAAHALCWERVQETGSFRNVACPIHDFDSSRPYATRTRRLDRGTPRYADLQGPESAAHSVAQSPARLAHPSIREQRDAATECCPRKGMDVVEVDHTVGGQGVVGRLGDSELRDELALGFGAEGSHHDGLNPVGNGVAGARISGRSPPGVAANQTSPRRIGPVGPNPRPPQSAAAPAIAPRRLAGARSQVAASVSLRSRTRCRWSASRKSSERSRPKASTQRWTSAASVSATRKLSIVIRGGYHV